VITAHTTTPSIWFATAPDSGYSVDNIAPAVPANFAVAYNTGSGNALSWDESPDEDFQYFRVYRSTDPNFTPSLATLAHETIAPNWSDPDYDGWTVYYKVTALDDAGNESGAANAGSVTPVEDPAVPRSFALHANVPNPFNPATTIRYDVPAGAANVEIAVFDVTGRRVRTLVEGVLPAGQHSVTWDGHDDRGATATSGIYFCRMSAGSFVQTRKMALLK
jgi:FlgD Ig-like domain